MNSLKSVPETPPRAIVYIRQSAKKEESISLELQETVCRDYCARLGYVVVELVADQISGQKWDKRPGIQKVMRQVQDGAADRVILYRWSRISRVRLHQALAIHLIEQAGAEVQSATESFDTKTAAGEFGRDMMLDFAVFQGKLIGEQWKEAHDRRRRSGLPHSGGPRFGYLNENGAYRPDPDLTTVYRWMYDEFIDGRGFHSLRDGLNRMGVRNSRGREWQISTITRVMDSGFAAGLLSRPISGGKFSYATGAHEPIISTETWETYLGARRVRSCQPNETAPKYRLSGLVKCGDCGGSMVSCHGSSGGAGYTYQCASWRNSKTVRCVTVKRLRVEDAVKAWLTEVARDVASASQSDRAARARVQVKADAQMLAREIAGIDKQMKELTKQLVAGRVPSSAYEDTRDELMGERAKLQERLDSARVTSSQRPTDVARIAVDLIRDWDVLPVSECRHLLSKLMARVVVTPNEKPYGRAKLQVVPLWDVED